MTKSETLTHLNESGEVHMVDVGAKTESRRIAVARSIIVCQPETILAIWSKTISKGEVLAVARVAGIMAAKRTSDLIPLCHSLPLSTVSIEIAKQSVEHINITVTAETVGSTGVEMEALTAASITALTIYDMCKSIDRGMTIVETCLLQKSGGKSGTWMREIPGT